MHLEELGVARHMVIKSFQCIDMSVRLACVDAEKIYLRLSIDLGQVCPLEYDID